MCSQLGIQPGAQSAESMGMVDLDVKLLGQLPVDRLNQLSSGVEDTLHIARYLLFLIPTEQRSQTQAVGLPKFTSFFGADVAFVTQDIQICMLHEQFKTYFQVTLVGGCQLEVENDAAQSDQQMQFVAEDRLLPRRHFAKSGLVGTPVACRTGHQMEMHNRNGQAVY